MNRARLLVLSAILACASTGCLTYTAIKKGDGFTWKGAGTAAAIGNVFGGVVVAGIVHSADPSAAVRDIPVGMLVATTIDGAVALVYLAGRAMSDALDGMANAD